MKFIIEIEIGALLPAEVCSVKAKTDRDTKTHRRGRSQATVRPCRRRTEIPERRPKQTQHSQSGALDPVSEARYVRPALRPVPGTGRHTADRHALPAGPTRTCETRECRLLL